MKRKIFSIFSIKKSLKSYNWQTFHIQKLHFVLFAEFLQEWERFATHKTQKPEKEVIFSAQQRKVRKIRFCGRTCGGRAEKICGMRNAGKSANGWIHGCIQ
jgi:hypothetical protein